MTGLVMVLTLGASGTHAQALYKSTMPDGKVVYSDKPAPGAKRVDTIEPPPAKTGTTVITPQEKARAEQLSRGRTTTAISPPQLDDARKQLQQLEAAREAGKEPLPSERLGTVGGASRLTEDYFVRQKNLEQAVENARKQLDQMQQGAR